MKILISSNTKKYFKTYIDFIDYYWLNFFDKKKYDYYVVPNSIKILPKYLKKKVDLIILSGGNDLFENFKSSKNRLKIEKKLIDNSIKKNIPLIGICRGMQLINYFFGGKIKRIPHHMRTKHEIKLNNNFFPKKKIKVNSFHNFGISKKILGKDLEILNLWFYVASRKRE